MCVHMKLYIFSSFKSLWMVLFLWYTSTTEKYTYTIMYLTQQIHTISHETILRFYYMFITLAITTLLNDTCTRGLVHEYASCTLIHLRTLPTDCTQFLINHVLAFTQTCQQINKHRRLIMSSPDMTWWIYLGSSMRWRFTRIGLCLCTCDNCRHLCVVWFKREGVFCVVGIL